MKLRIPERLFGLDEEIDSILLSPAGLKIMK